MSSKFINYSEELIKAHRDSVIRKRRGIATPFEEKRDSDDWFQKKQAALFCHAQLYSSTKDDDQDVCSNYSYAASSVRSGRQKLERYPTLSVEDVDRRGLCSTPTTFTSQP